MVASDPDRWVNGKVTVDGKEISVQAESNGGLWLRILEKEAMQQHIVADAVSFGNDLKSTGHAAVYGILFDTGKAAIKPESAQAIGEVADPFGGHGLEDLRGRTHGRGRGRRRELEALAGPRRGRRAGSGPRPRHRRGAAAGTGSGPFAPVASNDAEDGQRNRRVELVKQ